MLQPNDTALTAETIAPRPSGLRTLWRVAGSLGKGLGRDPAPAIGRPARLEVVLDAAKIAPYAALCGFDPVREPVPITYPHMLAFPLHTRLMTRDEFPYSAMGAIHLENGIEASAPLAPGDRLCIEARVCALFRHPGGQAVEIVTEVLREGERVWQSRSRYLFRGAKRPTGDAYAPALRLPGRAAATLQQRASWPLPASIGRRYARVSGDWNPIHVSRATALLFGLRHSIAHGMWMKARSVAAIAASPLLAPLLLTHRIVAVHVTFRTPAILPGRAALFAGGTGERDNLFEVRDVRSPRRLLRGQLRLAPNSDAPHGSLASLLPSPLPALGLRRQTTMDVGAPASGGTMDGVSHAACRPGRPE